jgi:hypothetical protein
MKPQFVNGLAEVIGEYVQQYLEAPKQQIGELVNRVDTLERRIESVAITRSQGRKVQKLVAERAHQVAKALDDSVRQHFANIYGGLKEKFNVPSYLDIPRDKFFEAAGLISRYDGSSRDWWRD